MSKKPDQARPAGTRVLKTRIKKKSGLKESSRRWLERHINDPYVQRSKADGYRSRAAYKLVEIDDRHKILKPGARVIDLGAAPGGWCQVAAARVKSSEEHPSVVGIDYLGMDPVPGATDPEDGFSRRRRARQADRGAGRRARRRALRHGGADHRASPHRPHPHHASGRSRRRFRDFGAAGRAAISWPRRSRAAPRTRCSIC